MPERQNESFEAAPALQSQPPAKKVKVDTVSLEDKQALSRKDDQRHASVNSSWLEKPEPWPIPRDLGQRHRVRAGIHSQRKPPRKAPSQVARSNRRAEEFKKKLLESGGSLSGAEPKPDLAISNISTDPDSPESRRHPKLAAKPSLQTSKSKPTTNSTTSESRALESKTLSNGIPPPITNSQPEATPNHANLKAKAASLQRARRELPIWPYTERIRTVLQDRNVLLLVGETGSGKSTQVPQFLMSERWCRGIFVDAREENPQADQESPRSSDLFGAIKPVHTKKMKLHGRKDRIGGCIAVTEPRRVAATTLARRVADEIGSPLGKASPGSLVGYSVRFDENTSPANKIKFLTEGMLLQEMLRDPWLKRYSAVIVDEVHERGVNVDLLLGFLRRLLTRLASGEPNERGGVPLKVVVMSATAEGTELVRFFQDGFTGLSPKSVPQSDAYNDNEDEWSGSSGNESKKESEGNPPQSTRDVATLYFRGRQHSVKIIHTSSPVADIVEASLIRIFTINYQEALPGDILVFLTGQRTVEALCALIEEYNATLSKSVPRILALPLFAALPQEAQRRVFEPTPPAPKGHRGFRKVIVSTNIAETSVTVPGVRYVIDGGKEKVKQFRPRIGLDSLLTKPISNSSAVQRAGRAGREAPGHCYRLYTEPDYSKLASRSQPEILRCDLAQTVLALMARGVPATGVGTFPLLTMPSQESVKAALVHLRQLGAVNDLGEVSEAGRTMAGLPVSASMAKALLKAAGPEMDCLDDMIDLVSAMSGEGIFLPSDDEGHEEADLEQSTRRDDLWRRDGDHATMIMAVRGFSVEHGDRRKWAEARGLSWRAMRGIMDIRKQLLGLRQQLAGSQHEPVETSSAAASVGVSPNLLRCLLAGFPLNAAILAPDGSYRTISGRQTVAIHPSSVLFRRPGASSHAPLPKPAAIVYTEFVYTTKAYARGVSAVEVDWIMEALGADWKMDDGVGGTSG